MIKTHFGKEAVKKIFLVDDPDAKPPLANDMYDIFEKNHNMEQIVVRIDTKTNIDEDLGYIQDMADEGELIIVAFKVSEGHGHVAFVGPRKITLETLRPKNACEDLDTDNKYFDNRKIDNVKSLLPIVVQAGTYSGITSIALATNNWNDNKEFLLANSIRFYRVKRD